MNLENKECGPKKRHKILSAFGILGLSLAAVAFVLFIVFFWVFDNPHIQDVYLSVIFTFLYIFFLYVLISFLTATIIKKKVQKLKALGDYDACIIYVQKILNAKIFLTKADYCYSVLGLSYLYKNELDKAIDSFTQLDLLSAHTSPVHQIRGYLFLYLIFIFQGRNEEADTILQWYQKQRNRYENMAKDSKFVSLTNDMKVMDAFVNRQEYQIKAFMSENDTIPFIRQMLK